MSDPTISTNIKLYDLTNFYVDHSKEALILLLELLLVEDLDCEDVVFLYFPVVTRKLVSRRLDGR